MSEEIPEHVGPREKLKQLLGRWFNGTSRQRDSVSGNLSRRDFLKFAGLCAASLGLEGLVPRVTTSLQDNLRSTESREKVGVQPIVIDYFESTSPESRQRLLDQVEVVAQDLDRITLPQLPEGHEPDEVYLAVENYKKFGNWALPALKGVFFDRVVAMASSHGLMVQSRFETVLSDFSVHQEAGEEEDTRGAGSEAIRIALQEAVSSFRIEVNEIGNLVGKLTIDEELLQHQLDSINTPSAQQQLLIAAFQFGEIGVEHRFYQLRQPEIVDIESNGELSFVWSNEVDLRESTKISSEFADDEMVFKIGQTTLLSEATHLDPYDEAAVELWKENKRIELINERLRIIRQQGENLSPELRKLYIDVNTNPYSNYWIQEPYNNQDSDSFDRLVRFSRANSQRVLVHAMGNNTDASWYFEEHSLPDNLIMVAGIGGLRQVRSRSFGTGSHRMVGGYPSDIYVRESTLYPQRESNDYRVLSSSESTGFVAAYIQKLLELGVAIEEVKQVIKDNCCIYFSEADEDPELRIDIGKYIGGHVFDRLKADRYLDSLSHEQNLQPSPRPLRIPLHPQRF